MGHPPLGAIITKNGCQFTVWSPNVLELYLHLLSPNDLMCPMQPIGQGYFQIIIPDIQPGARYFYFIDGQDYPDPASHYQPEGVFGPSEIISSNFEWQDVGWRNIAPSELIFYELHIGTFTDEGTFAAAIPELDRLCELGITAVEFMPIQQFSGRHNWGYDVVFPFAVQHTYGHPDDLRRLVDACHERGLAVFLDVVYNHFGPEGNPIATFGPYFTDKYKGSWGRAINFDGPGSDSIQHYFIQNALYWMNDFHIDGFRLDAIDHIVDTSAIPFWKELSQAIDAAAESTGRRFYLFAESDQNNTLLLRPRSCGGTGLAGHWLYDFHHSIYPQLRDEPIKYYQDFGSFDDLATLFSMGYVYQGQYAPRRGRRWGTRPEGISKHQWVAYMQTHDRVGNRPQGDRLTHLLDFEALKLSAACTLLSPFTPLLFMGEEYGETAPFQFFTDYADPQLRRDVSHGRYRDAQERGFDISQPLPDPNDEETFLRSKLRPQLRFEAPHRLLHAYYQAIISFRKTSRIFQHMEQASVIAATYLKERVLSLCYEQGDEALLIVLSFNATFQDVALLASIGSWQLVLNSAEVRWGSPSETYKVPTTFESTGYLHCHLNPWSVSVFQHIQRKSYD